MGEIIIEWIVPLITSIGIIIVAIFLISVVASAAISLLPLVLTIAVLYVIVWGLAAAFNVSPWVILIGLFLFGLGGHYLEKWSEKK